MRRAHTLPLSFLLFLLLFALPLATWAATADLSVGTFATGLTHARGLAVDTFGRLYISLRAPSGTIVRCTPPSNTMTLFASGLSDPIEMVFDSGGNLYVTNYNAGVGGNVFKITTGGTKSVFATILTPSGLVIDPQDNLYVGEYNLSRIDKITPDGTVSLYADLRPLSVNNHIQAMYRDADGTIYAGTEPGFIFKIGPGGSPITQFNRSGFGCNGIVKGWDGRFYSASYGHEEIWRIGADGSGALYTGAHDVAGHVDGLLGAARFNGPSGMVVLDGLIYCAEYDNNDVRTFDVDMATPAEHDTWGRLKVLFR
jgi:sugar lactone lactonase YvrE